MCFALNSEDERHTSGAGSDSADLKGEDAGNRIQAAEDFLRRGLRAYEQTLWSANSSVQRELLLEWATVSDRIVDPTSITGAARAGREHHVVMDPEIGRVFKFTKDGHFGLAVFDATIRNVMKIGVEFIPFDVIPLFPDAVTREFMELEIAAANR